MLTRNLTPQLANGSRGVVVGFRDMSAVPDNELEQQLRTGALTEFRAWLKANPNVPLVQFLDGEVRPVFPARCPPLWILAAASLPSPHYKV